MNIVIPGKVDAKVVQCWEYFGKDDKDLAPVWQQRDVKDKDNNFEEVFNNSCGI